MTARCAEHTANLRRGLAMQLTLSIADAEVRKCSRCLDFREWDGGKGWLGRWCPECQREYQRRYYAANADTERERKRQRYAANADAMREYHRRYRAANADVMREYHRRWVAANPDAARKYQRNRRARKANAICEHGPGCFDRAAQQMSQRCSVPGCRRKDIHADHIVSLAKGGLDCKANLQPLCSRHNSVKHTTNPIDFRRRLGMLI